MNAVLERGLPANVDAERLILGSMMLNDSRFQDVAGVLLADDFMLEKHRRIYARMADLHARGERIDRITIADELKKQEQLESVDGIGYLLTLDDGLPEVSNLDSYIRIVKDAALLRETMFACQSIIDRCAASADPTNEVLNDAAAILERVRNKGQSKHGQWLTPWDVIMRGGDSVLFPSRGSAGLKTPWARLTEMTSGWMPGDLVIVAGRPSMGKSVIGMQQAYATALQGVSVAFLSLEMSKESLTQRLIAGMSRVDMHRARSGYFNPDERRRMLESAADLETLPLFIDETRAHTPAAVSVALRKLRAKTKVGLVVVDHLQLMRATGRAESRHQELSGICHELKRFAAQNECVVMVLSQLNRSCEQERRRPNLSDLKESGSIEEDADVVAFIHRPEMYKRDDPSLRGIAELIVAKQRNGPTGKLALTFLHGFQVFEESTQDVAEEAA